jgi:hypothetical protein
MSPNAQTLLSDEAFSKNMKDSSKNEWNKIACCLSRNFVKMKETFFCLT